MRIALLCGGPSAERGISLNSARSVLDHLSDDGVHITPIYFDHKKTAYEISPAQLYSNTPSDFDFKLQKTGKKLSKTALVQLLKSNDIVFPAIHGAFGEDGKIQRFLEQNKIPYVGSSSAACKKAFDKFSANQYIRQHGFYTLPSAVLKIYHTDHKKILTEFFQKHEIKRAIVKPASGGSSIGVFSVETVEEALEKSAEIFSKRMDTRVVIEPFCEGIEFTTIILQNRFDMPVAILPTEIESSYEEHQIFDYRKKYLPTNQVQYHCPPRFSNTDIERIQVQAEQIFTLLGIKDFARFDGWLLPDGNIWFSDFNPISGMEQNSFLFQQCARIGMSHQDVLSYIVGQSCRRQNVKLSKPPHQQKNEKQRKPLHVIFGGKTAERQVSLMSGTNAWLKLRKSKRYNPEPYFLDLDHNVWKLPYALTLNHTVEEIQQNCENAVKDTERLSFLVEKVQLRLALKTTEATAPFFVPKKMSLQAFIQNAPFAFLGLHGGIGENGTLQKMLQKAQVQYNGPDAEASALCMDKYETGKKIQGLHKKGIFTAAKKSIALKAFEKLSKADFAEMWKELTTELIPDKQQKKKTLIVKPRDEGCSAGIIPLHNAEDLQIYTQHLLSKKTIIPANTLSQQSGIVELPLQRIANLLFEQFIQTDSVRVIGKKLRWKKQSGWIEVTGGILERDGKLHALNPSLTVSMSGVLSVEEKFQGGTGINITPPPAEILKPTLLQKIKNRLKETATILGITGYSRIDAFVNTENGDVMIIEANTLPALTPSTVIFQQALAEKPALFPLQLLEEIIQSAGY